MKRGNKMTCRYIHAYFKPVLHPRTHSLIHTSHKRSTQHTGEMSSDLCFNRFISFLTKTTITTITKTTTTIIMILLVVIIIVVSSRFTLCPEARSYRNQQVAKLSTHCSFIYRDYNREDWTPTLICRG